MNDTTLDPRSADALTQYLLVHEAEISIDENDFGTLYPVFKHIFRREPQLEASPWLKRIS